MMGNMENNQIKTFISELADNLSRRSVLLAGIYCFIILAAFHQTAWSMVAIWYRSETFVHGFLIVPIVIWLILGKKEELSELQPAFEPRALFALVAMGSLWLLGYLVDAAVVQQFAFIGLLVAGLWSILGSLTVWAIAFPLGYLFLAVPVGEGLIPPLMEFTADFTVGLLQITGIPVFREGLFFTLPSGSWSVVEGCSGVRYLIASFTLGCLYAYLNYRSPFKRLAFMGASLIVPIIANGLRAFMIVMIGHFSNMKLATGVDHLVYGWVFFGLVMLLLFSIGSIWRDPDPVAAPNQDDSKEPPLSAYNANKSLGLTLVVVLFWPLSAYLIEHQPAVVAAVPFEAPSAPPGWKAIDDAWKWAPVVHGPDAEIHQFYQNEKYTVSIYAGQFLSQNQGKELINSQNVFVVQKSKYWRITARDKVEVALQEQMVEVDRATIKGSGPELLTLRWYRLGDSYTANAYVAKLKAGLARLTFARQDAAYITVSISVRDSVASGKEEYFEALQGFIEAMLPALELSLDRVVSEASG